MGAPGGTLPGDSTGRSRYGVWGGVDASRGWGELPGGIVSRSECCTTKGDGDAPFSRGLYAVFHHAGPLSGLSETVDRVFEEWLPQVGVEISGEYYFEVYDDRFEPGKVDSILFLWVPVRRRE